MAAALYLGAELPIIPAGLAGAVYSAPAPFPPV